MVEQGKGGSIVHVSSILSKVVPGPGHSVYAATKSAVDSLAQAMALELGPHKVSLDLFLVLSPRMLNLCLSSRDHIRSVSVSSWYRARPVCVSHPLSFSYVAAGG